MIAPEELTQQLARRAVEIAQVIGPRRTGKGLNSLIPIAQPGIVGIDMPDEVAYMLDLDQGIQAHAMVTLVGRTIPIRNNDGTISFRRATANNVGSIPIISRASSNGRIRNQTPEWYYPNKEPLRFLETSINRSIDEWKRSTGAEAIVQMLLKTEERDNISTIFYGRQM